MAFGYHVPKRELYQNYIQKIGKKQDTVQKNYPGRSLKLDG